MTRRERRTATVALTILNRAARTPGPTVQTEAVQLALRVLLPYVDLRTLVTFWTVSSNPNPTQRMCNLRALVELIEAGVERAARLD